jgi:hypothetical protein
MTPHPDNSKVKTTEAPASDSGERTHSTLSLNVISAVASFVVTGIISFVLVSAIEIFESPGHRLPNWVAKFTVIIIVSIFFGIWKWLFAWLVQRSERVR